MPRTRTSGQGRRKGVPNKATNLAREAIAKLVDDNAPRMQGWLDQIAEQEGPAVAWKCLQDVIEYHIPKLARQEVVGDPDAPVEMRIRWATPDESQK